MQAHTPVRVPLCTHALTRRVPRRLSLPRHTPSQKLSVAKRQVVPTEFTERGQWARDLVASGFDTSVPTVWLLEGLLMYLSLPDTHDLMGQMGRLSAPGSAVFHDACSKRYINAGIVVGGAPFIGGSDEYGILWAHSHSATWHSPLAPAHSSHLWRVSQCVWRYRYAKLWATHGGFDQSLVRDFRSVSVDRQKRTVAIDPRVPEATEQACRGRDVVLFVEAVKSR